MKAEKENIIVEMSFDSLCTFAKVHDFAVDAYNKYLEEQAKKEEENKLKNIEYIKNYKEVLRLKYPKGMLYE